MPSEYHSLLPAHAQDLLMRSAKKANSKDYERLTDTAYMASIEAAILRVKNQYPQFFIWGPCSHGLDD